MNNQQKKISVMSVIVSATALVSPAHARSIPSTAGRTVFPGDSGCFVDRFGFAGMMINNCGRDVLFDIPLPADGSPPDEKYDVIVTARGETSPQSTVSCTAFGYVNSGGSVFWSSSGTRFLPILGASADIVLPSVSVDPGGALFVQCNVNNGAQLAYVNWR
jgi:hypothetical protein